MNGSLLFIISGPAGSGKGSVVAEVLRRDDRFMCAISATTRPCLAGEVDGVNYYYISREAFEEKIRTHGVLEYTEYCGNYYGTLKSEVERAKASASTSSSRSRWTARRRSKSSIPKRCW